MYVTAWCPACRKARAWFRANGINFEVRDVEQNKTWSRERTALNPRRSVPTIKIGGEVLVGFSPSRIKQAIARETGG